MADKLSAERLHEATDLFELFDEDETGSIKMDVLPTLLRAMGFTPSEKQCKEIMKKYDVTNTGSLNCDEFLNMVGSEALPPVASDEQLKAAFSAFDLDGSGSISREELVKALTTKGEPLTDKEAEALIRAVDQDKDGELNFQEFVEMLKVKDQKKDEVADQKGVPGEGNKKEDGKETEKVRDKALERSRLLAGRLQVGSAAVATTKFRTYFGAIRYVGRATNCPGDNNLVVCLEIELNRKPKPEDLWLQGTIFGVEHCLTTSRALFFSANGVSPLALGTLKKLPVEVVRIIAEYAAIGKAELDRAELVSVFAKKHGFIRPILKGIPELKKEEEDNESEVVPYSPEASLDASQPPTAAWTEFMEKVFVKPADSKVLLSLVEKFQKNDFLQQDTIFGFSALAAVVQQQSPPPDAKLVKALVDGGSLIISEGRTSNSPLHLACSANHKEACEILVGQNSSLLFFPGFSVENAEYVSYANNYGRYNKKQQTPVNPRPIDFAIRQRHWELVFSAFIKNPKFLRFYENIFPKMKQDPFAEPAKWKDVLRKLPNWWDCGALGTQLHVLAGKKGDDAKHFAEVLSCVPSSATLFKKNYLGGTVLHVAVSANNLQIATLLVDSQNDVAKKLAVVANLRGVTALEYALSRKKAKFVSLLQKIFQGDTNAYAESLPSIFCTVCATQNVGFAKEIMLLMNGEPLTTEVITAVSACPNKELAEAFFSKFPTAATTKLGDDVNTESFYYPIDHAVVSNSNDTAIYLAEKFGVSMEHPQGASRLLMHCFRHNNSTLLEYFLKLFLSLSSESLQFENLLLEIKQRQLWNCSWFPTLFGLLCESEVSKKYKDAFQPVKVLTALKNNEKSLKVILGHLKKICEPIEIALILKSANEYFFWSCAYLLALYREAVEDVIQKETTSEAAFKRIFEDWSFHYHMECRTLLDFSLKSGITACSGMNGFKDFTASLLREDITYYRQFLPIVDDVLKDMRVTELKRVPSDEDFKQNRITLEEWSEVIEKFEISCTEDSEQSKRQLSFLFNMALRQGSKRVLFFAIRHLQWYKTKQPGVQFPQLGRIEIEKGTLPCSSPKFPRKARNAVPMSVEQIVYQMKNGVPIRQQESVASHVVISLVVKHAANEDIILFLKVNPAMAVTAFKAAASMRDIHHPHHDRLALAQAIFDEFATEFFPISDEIATMQLASDKTFCNDATSYSAARMAFYNLSVDVLKKVVATFPIIFKDLLKIWPKFFLSEKHQVNPYQFVGLSKKETPDEPFPSAFVPVLLSSQLVQLDKKIFTEERCIALMELFPQEWLKMSRYPLVLQFFTSKKYWQAITHFITNFFPESRGEINRSNVKKFSLGILYDAPLSVIKLFFQKFGAIVHKHVVWPLISRSDLSDSDRLEAFKELASAASSVTVGDPSDCEVFSFNIQEEKFIMLISLLKLSADEKIVDMWKDAVGYSDALLQDASDILKAAARGGKLAFFLKYATAEKFEEVNAQRYFIDACHGKHEDMALALFEKFNSVYAPMFKGGDLCATDMLCACVRSGLAKLFSALSEYVTGEQFYILLGCALNKHQLHLLPILSKIRTNVEVVNINGFDDGALCAKAFPKEQEVNDSYSRKCLGDFLALYKYSWVHDQGGMGQVVDTYTFFQEIFDDEKMKYFDTSAISILKTSFEAWKELMKSQSEQREKFGKLLKRDPTSLRYLSAKAAVDDEVAKFLLELLQKPAEDVDKIYFPCLKSAVRFISTQWLEKLLSNAPAEIGSIQSSETKEIWTRTIDSVITKSEFICFELLRKILSDEVMLETLSEGSLRLCFPSFFHKLDSKFRTPMLQNVDTFSTPNDEDDDEGGNKNEKNGDEQKISVGPGNIFDEGMVRFSPSQMVQLRTARGTLLPGIDLKTKATMEEIQSHFKILLFSNATECSVNVSALEGLTHQEICDLNVPLSVLNWYDALLAHRKIKIMKENKNDRWTNFAEIFQVVEKCLQLCFDLTVVKGSKAAMKIDAKKGVTLTLSVEEEKGEEDVVDPAFENLLTMAHRLRSMQFLLLSSIPLLSIIRDYCGPEGLKNVEQFKDALKGIKEPQKSKKNHPNTEKKKQEEYEKKCRVALQKELSQKMKLSSSGRYDCKFFSTIQFSTDLFQKMMDQESTFTTARCAVELLYRYVSEECYEHNKEFHYEGNASQQLAVTKLGRISRRMFLVGEKDSEGGSLISWNLFLKNFSEKMSKYLVGSSNQGWGRSGYQSVFGDIQWPELSITVTEDHSAKKCTTTTNVPEGEVEKKKLATKMELCVVVPTSFEEAQQCLNDIQNLRIEKVAKDFFPLDEEVFKAVSDNTVAPAISIIDDEDEEDEED